MQTIIEVQCKKGPSLRGRIADDPRLESYGFSVATQAKPGRVGDFLWYLLDRHHVRIKTINLAVR